MSRSISLPEELLERAEKLATVQKQTLEQFVAESVSQHLDGLELLAFKASKASELRFREALSRIPDADPLPTDR